MAKLLSGLCWLHDWLTDASYVLGAASLFAMAVSYVIEVFARYIFNHPTHWASITISNLLLVTVMLLIPHVTRSASHISVNLIFQLVPAATRPIKVGINLVGCAICGFGAVISFDENLRQFAQTIYTEGIIQFPKWWVSPFITYGLLSTALWFLRLAGSDGAIRPRLGVIPHVSDS